MDKNLKTLVLKFGSEIENFRSEINLKNKISDLKLDIRNPLLSKQLSFYFSMFLQYTIMFRLTSGRKKFPINFTNSFFRTKFLVQL